MFGAGTVFRYSVTETVGGRPRGIPCGETYRILGIDGTGVKVEFAPETGEPEILETDTSCGSYVFRTDGFSVKSQSPIQVEIEDSPVYVDVLAPSATRCGGSEVIYLGRDGVVYRHVKTQMWSGGIICRETRNLVSVEAGGQIFGRIKWVEESGEETEDGTDPEEIMRFRAKHM